MTLTAIRLPVNVNSSARRLRIRGPRGFTRTRISRA
jgi:hypothetical protein